MKFFQYISFLLLLFPLSVIAQKESDDIRAGNRLYKEKKYTEAEIEYRKALQKNNKSFEANYNLGNALFRQGKYDKAFEHYKNALPLTSDKQKTAYDFHNLGNTFMSGGKIEEAISAYKTALKNNPKDNETRYNLAYAMSQLKKQQQDQNQNQNSNDNDKDQNQNQDNEKQQPKNNPDKKEEQPQPQQPQMSKENAQQILEALQQDELDTQEKAKNAQKRTVRKTDKDW